MINGKFSLLKDKTPAPGGRFLLTDMKNAVLGKKYELSLVMSSPKTMLQLNKKYRGLKKATDILSFSLNKNNGEIFLCPAVVKKNARKFGRDYENFFLFLFIHGLCHLKGMAHGSKMEQAETKFRKKFGI